MQLDEKVAGSRMDSDWDERRFMKGVICGRH